jgi:hypothetical protein
MADERTATGLPYAFFKDQGVGTAADQDETGLGQGANIGNVGIQVVNFPVFFDINLSEEQAANFVKYLEYSGYLDGSTAALSVSFVVYNSQLEAFMLVAVEFSIEEGGSITLTPSIASLRADPYSTASDRFRAVLEMLFVCVVMFNVYIELNELAAFGIASAVAIELAKPGVQEASESIATGGTAKNLTRRQRLHRAAALRLPNWYTGITNGGYRNGLVMYLTSFWNVVDLVNIGLQVYSMYLWGTYYFDHARSFRPKVRYSGLVEIGRTERWLQLHAGDLGAGAAASGGFAGVEYTFLEMQIMTGLLTSLRTVSCYSIAFMTFRTLKLLDFQPRLGLVTRTISKAAQDLLHFGLIFVFVFFAYACMGHLTFGGSVTQFSTLSKSAVVCMGILLGDIDVQTDLYRSNNIAANFFFWTFVFIAFFILINMLLAILVDAYVAVKDEAEGNRTVPQDCYHIASSMLPSNAAHRRNVDLIIQPLKQSFKLAAKRRMGAGVDEAKTGGTEGEDGTSGDSEGAKGADATAKGWRDTSGGDTVCLGTAKVTQAMVAKALRKLLPQNSIEVVKQAQPLTRDVSKSRNVGFVAGIAEEQIDSEGTLPELLVQELLAESVFKQLEHWDNSYEHSDGLNVQQQHQGGVNSTTNTSKQQRRMFAAARAVLDGTVDSATGKPLLGGAVDPSATNELGEAAVAEAVEGGNMPDARFKMRALRHLQRIERAARRLEAAIQLPEGMGALDAMEHMADGDDERVSEIGRQSEQIGDQGSLESEIGSAPRAAAAIARKSVFLLPPTVSLLKMMPSSRASTKEALPTMQEETQQGGDFSVDNPLATDPPQNGAKAASSGSSAFPWVKQEPGQRQQQQQLQSKEENGTSGAGASIGYV